jgi:hypothetical protein
LILARACRLFPEEAYALIIVDKRPASKTGQGIPIEISDAEGKQEVREQTRRWAYLVEACPGGSPG